MTSRRSIPAFAAALLVALAGAPAASAAPTITERALPSTSSPYDLALTGDGSVWFTEDSANRLSRLTAADALTSWGLATPASKPRGIVAGPDGNMWFTEENRDRIGRIAPDGTVTEFDVPTKNGRPQAIAAGPDGNLWFTASGAGKVGRITPGGVVTEFALPSASAHPVGIVGGPDGNLWVADSGANAVTRVTPAGVAKAFPLPTASSGASGIAVGPDGNLWFTQNAAGRIGRVTTSGTVTEFALPSTGTKPFDIAAGPDGTLWFTQQSAGALGRMTTFGAVADSLALSGSATSIVPGAMGTMWFTRGGAIGRITSPPAAATGASSGVEQTTAKVMGTVTPVHQAATAHVEYGPTTAYGKTSAPQPAGAGTATQAMSAKLTGLKPGTTYHYRVVGTSASGSTPGADATFTTDPPPPKVTISKAPIAVGSSGVAKVQVACPASAVDGCRGKVVLRLANAPRGSSARVIAIAGRCARGCRTLGQTKYQASRGKTRRVSVRMSKSGRRMLKTKKTLWTKVSVTTTAGGKTKTTSRTVRLRAR
jgi:streptogramin lyase